MILMIFLVIYLLVFGGVLSYLANNYGIQKLFTTGQGWWLIAASFFWPITGVFAIFVLFALILLFK